MLPARLAAPRNCSSGFCCSPAVPFPVLLCEWRRAKPSLIKAAVVLDAVKVAVCYSWPDLTWRIAAAERHDLTMFSPPLTSSPTASFASRWYLPDLLACSGRENRSRNKMNSLSGALTHRTAPTAQEEMRRRWGGDEEALAHKPKSPFMHPGRKIAWVRSASCLLQRFEGREGICWTPFISTHNLSSWKLRLAAVEQSGARHCFGLRSYGGLLKCCPWRNHQLYSR